jgi:hypothetical protein
MLLSPLASPICWRILLEARKVHAGQDYARMAEPILVEVQQREQEIHRYLSIDLQQPVAS